MTRRIVPQGPKLKLCHAILALAISGSLAPLVASAQSMESRVTYRIPAGDLASAIDTFSRQSGIQILYKPELLAGKRSVAVQGVMRNSDALKMLIGSAAVQQEKVNESTYILRAREERKVDLPKMPVDRASEQPEGKSNITSLPEILVKGSRSLNADIARTEDDIQPYVVFSREEIDLSQASNIEDFLSTRLPMNTSKGTMSRNTPYGDAGNRSSFNLRGIGTNQTLILVNGRRAPGVSTLQTGDLGQPDLNGIPLSSIERIEVLPTTASGIYGGGATGGVINIVLRKDYVGSEIRLGYDNSFDTDSARRKFEFSTEFALESGRTSIMLSGSVTDGNDLLVRDRALTMRGRRLLQQNNFDGLVGVLGRQVNIFSTSDLVLDNGTSLGSRYASVPSGYVGGDGGIGLLAGAGQTDISIPDTIAGGRQSLFAVPAVKSSSIAVRREFSDRIDGYLDYGYYRNEGKTKFSGTGAQVNLPGSAPGNPFTNAITIAIPYYDNNLERSSIGISETKRLNAGFTVKLGERWHAGLDFSRNVSKNTTRQQPQMLDRYTISDDIYSGALDVFRDLEKYPLDLSPYMTESLQGYGPGKATLKEYAARVGGTVADLPAGEVRLTAQISTRKESAGATLAAYVNEYVGQYAEYSSASYRYHPARHQSVRSFYIETTAPIVASFQNVPLVYSLDLQASLRRDEYTTVSVSPGLYITGDNPKFPIPPYSTQSSKTQSNDFTIGLKYKPIESVALRSSFGSGFLPPSLSQIAGETYDDNLAFLVDPLRNNALSLTGPFVSTVGGSSDLRPEQSRSMSAGVVYTPSYAPTLRLSADYTKIEKTDEIVRLSTQQMLDLEEFFPGRITRGANLPSDPAGYAGVITRINTTLVNSAKSKIEALDFQAEYGLDLTKWGELQLYGVATLQSALETQIVTTTPKIDRVGFTDGPLKWRGNAGVVWKVGSWTSSLNMQWYDSYWVYGSADTQASIDTLVLGQGSARVESQIYTDIGTRYTFKRGILDGAWISVAVRNVFDASPPILATNDSVGGYSTYGDPRGRAYVISLQKTF